MPGKGRRTAIAIAALGAVVIAAAAWSLRGAAAERWHIWRLGSRDAAAVLDAAGKLAARGSVRAIPAFLDLLGKRRSQDPRLILAFNRCLDRAGPGAVPALEDFLRSGPEDPDLILWLAPKVLAWQRQGAAAGALGRVAERGEPEMARRAVEMLRKADLDPLPSLRARLRSPDAASRAWALEAIGALGGSALPASPDLSAALRDIYPAVRLRAAIALVEVGGSDAGVLAVLDEGLRMDDREARILAIVLFGRLGARAAGRLPEAAAALTNLAPDVRKTALDRLGPLREGLLRDLAALDPPPPWLLDEARRASYDASRQR